LLYCPFNVFFQCNLLHDFPESGSKKFSYVRKKVDSKKRKEEIPAPSNTPITPSTSSDARYFDESSSSSQIIQNIPKITKTAPLLPDFIKI
jgi:predicted  nucleic acid-binding Zn-ribbon protein